MPYVVPPMANTVMSPTTRSIGLLPRRIASRLMPTSIAPVRIVVVMKAPTARTNRKIGAAP